MTNPELRAIAMQLLAQPNALELARKVYKLVADDAEAEQRFCKNPSCGMPFGSERQRNARYCCTQCMRQAIDDRRYAREKARKGAA